MHDVQRLLRLPRSTIRSLVHAGFVTPSRGARGAWRFSFQDLIVLRTAQALVDANVPARRITRSMRELKKRLPDAMPLIRARDRSGCGPGGRARRRRTLAGGIRPVRARVRGRSRERRAARDRACAAAARRRIVVRGGGGARRRRTPTGRSMPTSRPSRPTRRSSMRRINLGRLLHDRGDLAACRARLSRGSRDLRQRLPCCCSISACCSTTSIAAAEALAAYEAAVASRSRLRRRALQPRAALRIPRAREGRDPPHGALSRAQRTAVRLFTTPFQSESVSATSGTPTFFTAVCTITIFDFGAT